MLHQYIALFMLGAEMKGMERRVDIGKEIN
jgi:hypothetical protein